MRILTLVKFSLLLTLCASPASGLRVCSRKRYVFTSTAVLQRVHLPTPERCVERCVENMSYCKAAVFTPYKDKSMGVCTLYSENSLQQPTALHPDASVEPVSTVHELLENCPQFALPEITYKISSNHRRKLGYDIGTSRAADEGIKSDDFFPDREQESEERRDYQKDRYATMTPLYRDREDNIVQKYTDTREYQRPKSPFEGLQAIVPVAVLHLGQPMKTSYENCGIGAMCVPTFASLDASPCPARQGDPCAPKPTCLPAPCMHSEPHIMQSTWAEWSACSQTCGTGTRTRQCFGVSCVGPALERCSLQETCQEWSLWSSWTTCSATCGEGERKRSRECEGGRDCPGVSVIVETCATPSCPTWSEWGPWEGCSITCGSGQERRSRKCRNGSFCPGPPQESRPCDRGRCPRWSIWTQWTPCSRSCNTGETYRTRDCEYGSCDGASEERLLCNQQDCPAWTEWTAWTVCANKCDEDSFRIRSRNCFYNGVPHTGCEGPAQDQSVCPTRACPVWSEWGEWSDCSATCGQGNQARLRSCETGTDCLGSNREMRFCQLASCPYWDEWMSWGGCSVSCGVGVCERRRRCVTDDLLDLPNLEELDEGLFEMNPGKAKSELIARSRSEARNAAYHNRSDENAAERSRRAPFPRVTIEGGGTCTGTDVERKPCDAGPCCSWEPWTEWSPCVVCGSQSLSKRSRICQIDESHALFSPIPSQVGMRGDEPSGGGGGSALRISDSYRLALRSSGVPTTSRLMAPIIPVNIRRRRHTTVPSSTGGQCCEGAAAETRACGICEQHQSSCEWNQWGEWCGCTPCQEGREVRRRFCEKGSAQSGPRLPDSTCSCRGEDSDERICTIEKHCETYRTPEGGGSSNIYGDPSSPMGKQPKDDSESSSGIYVPIDSKHKGDEALDRRGLTSFGTGSPYPSCRWSKWSDWSKCHETKTRQRNRFCINSDELISDCECMGYSTEEESCIPPLISSHLVNEVIPPKDSSNPYFDAEDDRKLEEDIRSALKSEGLMRASQDNVSLTASVIKTEKCEWTRWSQWSMCTVTCGTGERVRKRRCGCGDLHCGSGTSQETTKCSERNCDRKMPPTFVMD